MDEIDSVRVQEIVNYHHYDQTYVMREMFGFGQPVDYAAPLFTTGMLTGMWGGVVTLIADTLGVELEAYPAIADWLGRLSQRPAINAELEIVAALAA